MAVLSLSDAKDHLNITGSTHDGELQAFINAAEAVIAAKCGPLSATNVTATVVGGSRSLVLPTAPVVSLTSVTPHEGTVIAADELVTDLTTGVVSYYDSGWFGESHYTVVYVAGRSTVPADLLLAVKELLRHLWKTQRGGTRRPGSTDEGPAPAAYMLPNRVAELLAPHMQVSVA